MVSASATPGLVKCRPIQHSPDYKGVPIVPLETSLPPLTVTTLANSKLRSNQSLTMLLALLASSLAGEPAYGQQALADF
jgi:hypothetical protein